MSYFIRLLIGFCFFQAAGLAWGSSLPLGSYEESDSSAVCTVYSWEGRA